MKRSLGKLRDALLRQTKPSLGAGGAGGAGGATDMDVEGGGGDGGETKGETKGETTGETREVAVVDVRSAPLALPMMVLIAQQRDHLVYHTQTKHIKLIGYLTDQCQMILGQFLDFQQQHLEPHVAAEAKKGHGDSGGGNSGGGGCHALVPSLDILRQWHGERINGEDSHLNDTGSPI